MLTWFRSKHFLPVTLSLLTATIVISGPLIYTLNSACLLVTNAYGPDMPGDSYFSYAPRTIQASKGYWGIGDTLLFEHRSDYRNTFEKFPPIITGLLQTLTHNIDTTFILSQFIFILLTYLTGYHFLTKLGLPKPLSHLTIFALITLPELTFAFPLLPTPLQYLRGLGEYLRRYYLTLTTFPFFLLFLILAHDFHHHAKLKSSLLLGIISGFQAYLYFYYWLFAQSFIALLTLFKLAKHRFKHPLTTLLPLFISLTVSIPFLLNLITYMDFAPTHTFATDFHLDALHAIRSHFHSENTRSLLRLLLIAFAAVTTNRFFIPHGSYLKNRSVHFLLLAILSSELALNSNIATGISVQFYHLGHFVSLPLTIFLTALTFHQLLIQKTSSQTANKLTTSILIIVIAMALLGTFTTIKSKNRLAKLCDPQLRQLANYLNTLPSESVFLSIEPLTDTLLQNYTDHYQFVPNGYLTTAAYPEIFNRLSLSLQILDYSPSQIQTQLDTKQGPVFYLATKATQYAFAYNQSKKPQPYFPSLTKPPSHVISYYAIPQEFIDDLTTTSQTPTTNPYRLDYAILNSQHKPPPPTIANPIFSTKHFNLYQINSKTVEN